MYINTRLSSFCVDKEDDPTFWTALAKERDALCRQLDTDGDCLELVQHLSRCSAQPCWLAACPVCLAKADQNMFESMRYMCQGKGETVFSSEWRRDSYTPCVDDCADYFKDVGDRIETSEIDVDSYIGRVYCKPFIERSSDNDYRVSGYSTGFVGAMRMTDFPLKSEDDHVVAADNLVGNHKVRRIYLDTDFYEDDLYCHFDRNTMPWEMRCAKKIKRSRKTRDAVHAHEAAIAKALGLKPCNYLFLRRLAKNQ